MFLFRNDHKPAGRIPGDSSVFFSGDNTPDRFVILAFRDGSLETTIHITADDARWLRTVADRVITHLEKTNDDD